MERNNGTANEEGRVSSYVKIGNVSERSIGITFHINVIQITIHLYVLHIENGCEGNQYKVTNTETWMVDPELKNARCCAGGTNCLSDYPSLLQMSMVASDIEKMIHPTYYQHKNKLLRIHTVLDM